MNDPNDPYATPEAWAWGSDRVYEALGTAALAEHASSLRGRRVLDLGAGTGATSRAVVALGGHRIAIDRSMPMLQQRRMSIVPAILADACTVPIGDDALDATVAAFVLSHVADPVTLLREAGRVTTPGGAVLALSFAGTGARSVAHDIVEGLLRDRGWFPTAWFSRLKEEFEPGVADPARVHSMALAAGLRSPAATTRAVDTGIDLPGDLVDWRLGSPGVAWFVDAMSATDRKALRAEAVDALGPAPQPLVLELCILSARAAANRRRASG